MQARAEVSVFFFFFLSEASPGRLTGDQRVMCTETESFRVFQGSGARTYKHTVSHPAKAFAFNINLSHVEKTHATSRLCAAHM